MKKPPLMSPATAFPTRTSDHQKVTKMVRPNG